MRRRAGFLGAALLPTSVLLFVAAFRFPGVTESWYAQAVYPWIARGFASLNRTGFSVAEPLAMGVVVAVLVGAARLLKRREIAKLALSAWIVAGLLFTAFLVSWGFNYARAPLRERLKLAETEVTAERVLASGRRAARRTGELYAHLPDAGSPSPLPMSFEGLDRELDLAFERLELTGDRIRFAPTPAKPLWSSRLFSYLGISGIFVPFTGEPSVNVLQPDPSLPIVVAHEKAHQRGITDEGEANFAAFLACSLESNPIYLRYAAHLFATRYLLGAASRSITTEELGRAWALAGEGPVADTRAIYDFWTGFEGAASDVAAEVNDLYLESMRVPQGIASYGTVVELLVALDASRARDEDARASEPQ